MANGQRLKAKKKIAKITLAIFLFPLDTSGAGDLAFAVSNFK